MGGRGATGALHGALTRWLVEEGLVYKTSDFYPADDR